MCNGAGNRLFDFNKGLDRRCRVSDLDLPGTRRVAVDRVNGETMHEL